MFVVGRFWKNAFTEKIIWLYILKDTSVKNSFGDPVGALL
jgi:hypothetical protein